MKAIRMHPAVEALPTALSQDVPAVPSEKSVISVPGRCSLAPVPSNKDSPALPKGSSPLWPLLP